MDTAGVRRLAGVAAALTFSLVVAGGLVTSNDASLSIPDWPLAWGKLLPPWIGGIRFAFAHRVVAAAVAVTVVALAWGLQRCEPRIWVRRLGRGAVAAVLAQALLGGAVVIFVDPRVLSIAHAGLAQLCFGLVAAVAVAECRLGGQSPQGSIRPAQYLAVIALFAQAVLGAAVRHGAISVIPHVAGAVVTAIVAMWAALEVMIRHMEDARLRRPATLLLTLTMCQVFLGIAAYLTRVATADAGQPMPVMIWATVAHLAVGTLAFGAAIALAMIYLHEKPSEPELCHGGVAVA